MRRVSLALVLLLVCLSAATGVPVHASTECERWISEYRTQLTQSDLVKRANAARHRLHRYVHTKIALLNKPKPHPTKVLPAHLQRPKMTREEMLRELEFACGELPLDPVNLNQPVAFAPAANFLAKPAPADEEMPLLAQNGPQSLLTSNDGPSEPGGWNPGGAGGIGGGGGYGGGGGKNPTPPTGGTGGNNPPPDNPPPSNPPPTNPPPTAVAPEPGSLLLVATGLIGAAGVLHRRFRRGH